MTAPVFLSGATTVCAVVGDPVRHSLSPRIHNRWMREAGHDAVYVALHLESETPEQELRSLWSCGFLGLNVTVPHKMAALKSAHEASAAADRIGAANTLVRGRAGWVAHNTDLDGFALTLSEIAPQGVKGEPVLLLGAGGAARAAVDVLQSMGARLSMVNRTRATAERLRDELAPDAAVYDATEIQRLADDAALVIDSTSAGHAGEGAISLPRGQGRPFWHLSYGDAAEPALSTAGRAGWTPRDGLQMLVGQAAAAFRLWFGGTPDMASALADCRGALARAP